ncbi:MAG: DNA polymerase III subunit theta [Proteus vulgaris]
MNLANLTQEEKDKINVDLAASGVAYKERLNMPVVASEVERQQPAHLRAYFNERLAFYRERSKKFPDANSVQCLKSKKCEQGDITHAAK